MAEVKSLMLSEYPRSKNSGAVGYRQHRRQGTQELSPEEAKHVGHGGGIAPSAIVAASYHGAEVAWAEVAL